MFLDSSPPPYADCSGYAESQSDPSRDCEAARVPFYAQSATVNQRHLSASSGPGKAASPSFSILSRSSSLEPLTQLARLSYAPSYGSSQSPASPSHVELPSPLAEAQLVSGTAGPRSTQAALEPLQLSPSNHSRFSWSELASLNVFSSPGIPQASLPLFPPHLVGLSDAEESVQDGEYVLDAQDVPSQGSIASSQHDSIDDAPGATAWPTFEEGTIQWDYVALGDVLGGLFEDADPWNALSKLLGLPPSSVNPSDATEDSLAVLGASDRRGVGYMVSGSPLCSTSFPTSQGLTDEDAPLSTRGDIVPPGLHLSRGDCEPCAGHQAREVEAEFVESPITETVLPHGSSLPPRCSGKSRNPSRQSSVMSLEVRPGTATKANQVVK